MIIPFMDEVAFSSRHKVRSTSERAYEVELKAAWEAIKANREDNRFYNAHHKRDNRELDYCEYSINNLELDW